MNLEFDAPPAPERRRRRRVSLPSLGRPRRRLRALAMLPPIDGEGLPRLGRRKADDSLNRLDAGTA